MWHVIHRVSEILQDLAKNKVHFPSPAPCSQPPIQNSNTGYEHSLWLPNASLWGSGEFPLPTPLFFITQGKVEERWRGFPVPTLGWGRNKPQSTEPAMLRNLLLSGVHRMRLSFLFPRWVKYRLRGEFPSPIWSQVRRETSSPAWSLVILHWARENSKGKGRDSHTLCFATFPHFWQPVLCKCSCAYDAMFSQHEKSHHVIDIRSARGLKATVYSTY